MINLIQNILHSTCRIAYSTLHILQRYSTSRIYSTFYFAISGREAKGLEEILVSSQQLMEQNINLEELSKDFTY